MTAWQFLWITRGYKTPAGRTLHYSKTSPDRELKRQKINTKYVIIRLLIAEGHAFILGSDN